MNAYPVIQNVNLFGVTTRMAPPGHFGWLRRTIQGVAQ